MIQFRTCIILLALLLPLSALPVVASAHIVDVNRGGNVTFDQMIADLAKARVVFIGELHDNKNHHDAQLRIIQALQQQKRPLAIALEMFRAENQEVLDRWVSGKMGEGAFRREFERNWGMWPYYEDILKYARQQRLPLVALNVPRQITQKVARTGFESLTPEEMEQIPGVACDVNPEYQAYIRRTLGTHAHGGASFKNFCEAQMVWDTAMAHNLMEYLRKNPDTTVVVLAGSGHAWKFGIPEQIRRQQKIESRVVLPEITGRITQADISPKESDYLLLGLDQGPMH
jgi:uncharacterized iron-regulated protein